MTMKTKSTQGLLLKAIGVAVLATGVQAAPFVYNAQDLLLGIQSTGANEFVANIGSASTYTGAAAGSTFAVGGYTPSQITSAFGGFDGLSLSISGDIRTSGSASGPLNTLWLTQARTDINVQTDPWLRKSSLNQGNTGTQIDGIAAGAVTYSGTVSPGPNNTATAVVMPTGTAVAGNPGVGPNGDYNGAFTGNVQGLTQAGFSAGTTPVRLDLYEVRPGAGATLNTDSTFLGYFDFNPNGSLTFTAVPEPGAWALLGIAGLLFVATQRMRRTA